MKKVSLIVNGVQRQFVVEPDYILLDLLRKELRLTGTKQSCDRKGQCGACTVIVNGKSVRSCLTKVVNLDGAEVITIEGLGTPKNPHLIQEAFALSGAIQCGFCTPGMIMAAKALLDKNRDPSVDDIKKALRRNLCRCTGYKKIIEAVRLAARFLRGELTPDQVRPDPKQGLIGVSHPRPSAMIKACGVAEFAADIHVSGAGELATVHSPYAHALIKSIDTSAAERIPGVIGIMTAKDIKGTNRLKYMVPDRPILCDAKVRFIGDPVAAVLAETREQAVSAAQAVKVEYELLPVMMTPEEALAVGALQIDPDRPNLCFTQPQIRGDAEAALEKSAAVLETDFSTQTNHQAPLEPEACVAYLEEENGDLPTLVVIGRSINIHYHMGMLQDAVGYENMRYEEAYSGGQFGIKIDVTSEGLAAAAALHFRRPVRYIPSLVESMWLTSKRHAFRMKVRLGADARGKLTAYCIDFTVNNGAYYSNGNVIVNRALLMLSGSYYIPAVRAMSRLVYTNTIWGAAARGAGPPQVNYALESAMDMLAEKMGIDPLEFRLMNILKPGQPKSTGRVAEQWPLPELMEAIRPHYNRARNDASEFNRKGGTVKRGVGLGTGSFGIGGPGDTATVAVELDLDGGLTVFGAAADPGEGNDSMLTQIAAHLMNLPMDKIRLVTRTTGRTTAAGPAAGSRITYMLGGALVDAIHKLKSAMAEVSAVTAEQLQASGKPTRYMGTKKNEDAGPLDPQTGQGPSFESQVHAVQLAEVEVNTATGEVRVVKMTTAVDAGRVINPKNLEGQLEGGMDMGVGFALREIYIDGQTKDWVSFKFPTIGHSFEMETIIRETPRTKGPLGATGVGEMTMVPTAPAMMNAIANACGARVRHLPATPNKVLAALREAKG
ncbi:MAG TPA: molybdopterin cofactor-binding domain-containing protein [Thermodesulfobacteriota bacterium]|nr:molybdopterin cofactor-binding domain-containing protein [Thermodesulfobacteriota bacterium]